MLRVTRHRLAAVGIVLSALVLAALLYQNPRCGITRGLAEGDAELPNSTSSSRTGDDSPCASVTPILERLVDLFSLSKDTSVPIDPIPEVVEIDAGIARLLQVFQEETSTKSNDYKLGRNIVTHDGYHISFDSHILTLVSSPDERSILYIYPKATTFRHGDANKNVRITCYTNDEYRVYVAKHVSAEYDDNYVCITVISGMNTAYSLKYKAKRSVLPRVQGVTELRKAQDPEYVLTGFFSDAKRVQ